MVVVSLAVAFASAFTSTAFAVTIELPGKADRTPVTYTCKASENAEPAEITVEYINLPESSLAIVPLDGQPTMFVNVLSGSGAQYVSGRMVWWTKGPGARLYDVTNDDPAKATLCRVKR